MNLVDLLDDAKIGISCDAFYLLLTAGKTLNWKTYLVFPTLKMASKVILRRKIMAKLLADSVAANSGPVMDGSEICQPTSSNSTSGLNMGNEQNCN